jgi:hypothetical protein
VLSENSSLTHLDISHNSINMDGALAIAEGIEGNKSLLELELGFNPMGMTQKKVAQQYLTGLEAIVRAIRLKEHLSSVGMTECTRERRSRAGAPAASTPRTQRAITYPTFRGRGTSSSP